MSFNAIHENKIITKISGFTVFTSAVHFRLDFITDGNTMNHDQTVHNGAA